MIVICHGMVKSASSFATQIALMILQHNAKEIVSLKKFVPQSNGLFLGLEDNLCDLLRTALPKCDQNVLVVKSHADFPADCKDLLRSESIKVISTFRDPAEISLSLIDAGRKDEALGRVRFNAYKSIADTLDTIDWQITCSSNWLKSPANVLPLYYDDFTTDPMGAAQRIASLLGLRFEKDMVARFLHEKNLVWEFNKGILSRAEKEMDAHIYKNLKNRWQEFYQLIKIKREESK
jgi:hypothetical protein